MKPALKAALLAALLGAVPGCGPKAPGLPALNRLESYSFNPASLLETRIKLIPAPVLEFFRAFDSRPDYAGYAPSAADRALVLEYLRLLPPAYEKTFRQRCLGVYFVPDMVGYGLADWVAGPDGTIYFQLILNAAVLRESLSETLTSRERTCFIPRAGWSLRVDAGTGYKGLLYALAHEGGHGLDYAAGLTPYTDDMMPPAYRPRRPLSGGLFLRRWADYAKPRPEFSFPGRDQVTFYGFGGGPKLDIGGAADLYRGMMAAGFVSLYASKSWAETLADTATFGVLSGLGLPYRITVAGPGGRKEVFEPMKGPAARQAAEVMELLGKIKI